jgi:hypothetical protein
VNNNNHSHTPSQIPPAVSAVAARSSTAEDRAVVFATSFAQRLIIRGGSFACPHCRTKVKTLPHRCANWGAR